MLKVANFILSIALLSACTTVENIRKQEPVLKLKAKQDVTSFRDCVADVMYSKFGTQAINKFENGLVLGRNVSVLIEQMDGYVYVYELGDLLAHRKLPRLSASNCNDNPNVGILDFY